MISNKVSINFVVVALGGGEQISHINVKQNTDVAFPFVCFVVAKEILEAPISKEDMAIVIESMAIVKGPCLKAYHFVLCLCVFIYLVHIEAS